MPKGNQHMGHDPWSSDPRNVACYRWCTEIHWGVCAADEDNSDMELEESGEDGHIEGGGRETNTTMQVDSIPL